MHDLPKGIIVYYKDSFQGVIVIRLPRNFVYLYCMLYLLMINDLNTTSLVYLWSVDTVSQSFSFR